MKIATILYGQPRTFKYTFPSIKRLFKDILQTDMYVIINENLNTPFNNNLCGDGHNNDSTVNSTDIDLLIDELNPVVYKKINIDNIELLKYYTTDDKYQPLINTIKNTPIYSCEWNEYAKNPTSDNAVDIQSCIENGCELKTTNNINLKLVWNLNNVELYLRNMGLFYVNLNTNIKKYTHVMFLRTDVMWFENYNIKCNIIKNVSISDSITMNNIIQHNSTLHSATFTDILNMITNNVLENKEDILTYFFHKKEFNIYMPVYQASFFRIDNIIPERYYKNIQDFEEFLLINTTLMIEQVLKYPAVYPGWDGEYNQKILHTVYNNVISKTNTFGQYTTLLRGNKVK